MLPGTGEGMLVNATVETLSEGADADAGVAPMFAIPTKSAEIRRNAVEADSLRRTRDRAREGWAFKTGLLQVNSGAMARRASHPPSRGVNTRGRGIAESPMRYPP